MDDNIVLASLSLRSSRVLNTNDADDNILKSVSMRSSRVLNTNEADDCVLKSNSVAIAGYEHSGSTWTPPEEFHYVIIED